MEITKLLLAAVGLLFLIWKGISFLRRSMRRDKDYEDATNIAISAYRDIADNHKEIRDKLKESFREKEDLLKEEIQKLKKNFSNASEEAAYYEKLVAIYQSIMLEAYEILPEYCYHALSESKQYFEKTMDSLSENHKFTEQGLEKAFRAIADDDVVLDPPYDSVWRAGRAQIPVYTLISHLKTFVDMQLHATVVYNETPDKDIEDVLEETQKRTVSEPMDDFFEELHSFDKEENT